MTHSDDTLAAIDAALADNTADRDAHPADPSIADLVDAGRLPPAALEFFGPRRQRHAPIPYDLTDKARS